MFCPSEVLEVIKPSGLFAVMDRLLHSADVRVDGAYISRVADAVSAANCELNGNERVSLAFAFVYPAFIETLVGRGKQLKKSMVVKALKDGGVRQNLLLSEEEYDLLVDACVYCSSVIIETPNDPTIAACHDAIVLAGGTTTGRIDPCWLNSRIGKNNTYIEYFNKANSQNVMSKWYTDLMQMTFLAVN